LFENIKKSLSTSSFFAGAKRFAFTAYSEREASFFKRNTPINNHKMLRSLQFSKNW